MAERGYQFQEVLFCSARDRGFRAAIVNCKTQSFIFDSHPRHRANRFFNPGLHQREISLRFLAHPCLSTDFFRSVEPDVMQNPEADSLLQGQLASSAHVRDEHFWMSR